MERADRADDRAHSGTIDLLIIAVIGGLARVEGAWLGAFAFIVINNYVGNWVPIPSPWAGSFNTVIGFIFLAIVIVSPDGLMGSGTATWARRPLSADGRPAAATSGGRREATSGVGHVRRTPRRRRRQVREHLRKSRLLAGSHWRALALVAVGCGGDDDDGAADTTAADTSGGRTGERCRDGPGQGRDHDRLQGRASASDYELDIGGAQAALGEYAGGKANEPEEAVGGHDRHHGRRHAGRDRRLRLRRRHRRYRRSRRRGG